MDIGKRTDRVGLLKLLEGDIMVEGIYNEKGFTLVELLVITGTLSVLMMLSVHSYGVYRSSAFDSSTEHSIHHIKSALQAGLIDNDFMEGIGLVWASLQSAGLPSSAAAQELLPGYVHPSDMQLWVSYDAWCANGILGDWCTETSIQGRHCSGNTWYLHQSFHNGIVTKIEWQAPGGC